MHIFLLLHLNQGSSIFQQAYVMLPLYIQMYHNPLKFYGIPGIIFLCIGLGFIAWTIQVYALEQEIITNISLIGIGCIVLGTVLLMTAVILFSIVTVVSEKK